MGDFNPYREWLGISGTPANHYELLGLEPFEADPQRIQSAADEQMAKVRAHQTGPRGAQTQPLLNELSAARVCLSDQQMKSEYDHQLQATQNTHQQAGLANSADDLLPPSSGVPLSAMAPAMDSADPELPPAVMPQPSVPPAAMPQPPAAAQPMPQVGGPPLDRTGPPAAMSVTPPANVVTAGSSASPKIAARSRRTRNSATPILWASLFGVAVITLSVLFWIASHFVNRDSASAESSSDTTATETDKTGSTDRQLSGSAATDEDEGVVVAQESSGAVNLSASTATLVGDQLKLTTDGEGRTFVTNWDNEAEMHWRFRVVRPGFFRVEVTYRVSSVSDAPAYFLALDEEEVRSFDTRRRADRFVIDEQTFAVREAGVHTLAFAAQMDDKSGKFELMSVNLIPK